MDQDGTWHGGRPRPRRLCVRWGPSTPSPKRGRSPLFSAHVYCGQTAACIKMPVSMEVGLGPDDIVLHGDPAPSPKWRRSPLPNFRPISIVAKRLDMHQNATWYEVRPQPRGFCVRCGPSPPLQKRAEFPQFLPMSIVTKRLDGWKRHLVRK